jgi:hypothetical protein
VGFALAATLASALAAAAARSACAVNVRKFLNLEITHFYYSCYECFEFFSCGLFRANAEAGRTLVLIARSAQVLSGLIIKAGESRAIKDNAVPQR